MNPLARSRLEAAKSRLGMMHLNWQHADVDNETIHAALDALLNPTVTDGMYHSACNAWDEFTDPSDSEVPLDIYKAMISELTRDV